MESGAGFFSPSDCECERFLTPAGNSSVATLHALERSASFKSSCARIISLFVAALKHAEIAVKNVSAVLKSVGLCFIK